MFILALPKCQKTGLRQRRRFLKLKNHCIQCLPQINDLLATGVMHFSAYVSLPL